VRARVLIPLAALLALAACGGDGRQASATTTTATTRAATTPDAGARAAARPRLVRVGRFDNPVYVTAPAGDRRRVFVVEQRGVVRVVRGGRTLGQPFLDISDRVRSGGEQGLLSIAFAPDYARTGRLYVDYTDRSGNTVVAEYRRSGADADRADPGTAREVLTQRQPEENHNGGQLQFGPDGLLYIGLGDGGGADDQHGRRGNAQDLGTMLGKILRIDPRPDGGQPYGIPGDNPFRGRAGARPEIYAYGLRNPWRFSFDRRTGDLTIGDVGQGEVEEIDFRRRGTGRGVNFGWRPFEGSRRNFDEPAPGAVMPALEYSHGGGRCSVTGGYVVRDRALRGLVGRYVFGDYCTGELTSTRLRLPRAAGTRGLGLQVPSLTSFGEDGRGRVYAASADGPVYRLATG